jgi:hypothetical protein
MHVLVTDMSDAVAKTLRKPRGLVGDTGCSQEAVSNDHPTMFDTLRTGGVEI